MKKGTKKLLSLLLALAMILTLAPIAVFAEDEPVTGEPVVVEEPVEEPSEATGSVVAVVYGDAFEAALQAVEQDYNLLEDEVVGNAFGGILNPDNYRGRTIPKLQDVKGDATPEAEFVLVDAAGNETTLTKVADPKGSEYVEVVGERPDLVADALDAIKANNFTVYKADVLPGNYTIKLKYLVEPYGLRNNELLAQAVTVEAGQTTIAGGDAYEVRGHVNETVQVEDGVTKKYQKVGSHEETYTLFGKTYTRTVDDYDWVEVPKYKNVTTTYELTLNFPGYFLRKETLGFKFRTTDVAGTAVQGAEFVMVNRDDLLNLLKPVLGLGKDVFTVAVGQFTGENLPTFEELTALYQSITTQNEQGFVTLSWDGIQKVITGYIASLTTAIGDAHLEENFIERGEDAGPLGFKFKYPLPAILAATSDENGVVTFDTTKNVTLTFLLEAAMNLGMDTLMALSGNNEALNTLFFPIKLIMNPDEVSVDDLNIAALANIVDLIPSLPGVSDTIWNTIKTTIKNAASTGEGVIDGIFSAIDGAVNLLPGVSNFNSKESLWNGIVTFVKNSKDTIMDFLYGQLQNIGIVGDKISKGNYLLFEYKTPDAVLDEEGNVIEDFSRSPLVYTVNVDWKEPDNIYASVTDLGLIGPYIAPQFYDFVRNTQYEGVVAKYFGKKAWDYDFLSKLMTGRIALAEKEKQQVEGAFTAFMAYSLYDALGLDLIFNTRTALMEGMNDYLVSQKDTATNLRNYVNTQAKKAKSVYAGSLTPLSAEVEADDLWTFYTLDASPTLTATKLIDKSTKDIAAAFPEGSERQKGILQNGGTVSSIVSRIGNSIEGAVKSVVSRIQEAIGSAVENAIKSVTDGVKNIFTGLLKNLFNNSNETPSNAGA